MLAQIVIGACIGCMFGLLAQAFVLTYRTTNTLNFANGEVAAFGAFLALGLAGVGWIPTPAKLVVVAIAGAILGALLFTLVIRHFMSTDGHDPRWLLVTVAISVIAVDLLRNSQGTHHRSLGFAQLDGALRLGSAAVPKHLIMMGLFCLALGLGIAAVVTYTTIGIRMRAVAEDPQTAEIVGIDSMRLGVLSYAISSAAVAVAAVFWTGYVGVYTDIGPLLLVPAFAAAVIGGLYSVWGALAGGVLYGVAIQVLIYLYGAIAGDILSLAAVVAVLIARPYGLFAAAPKVKV